MTDQGTVAPRERINIRYVPATGDQQAESELPLKLLVVGDFKGRIEEAPIEERTAVSVDKNNFHAVLSEAELGLEAVVPNRLADSGEDNDLPVNLSFAALEDFAPDRLARQVPELRKLIELREALVALKGPLGNVPSFRKRLQELLDSEEVRDQLLDELSRVTPPEDHTE
ncbi:type VI secretion system protein ImpB [Alkalispirillum mobile]|uniref:Type VI secretion system protein ImpB n=1 Tax=Alkalispirillum mobile TaxID=85925 RepID=A0A498C748_9GAMM|nr:type VI secretion system contractile sheath small subunit [Alkalispirillum mobile]RLK51715.1 type VI secretion system protein ImpB [Alkalispirillum mobile]